MMAFARRGILYESTVDLTAAQIRTWHTTPITAAPAPGANRLLLPESYCFLLTPGSQVFAAPGSFTADITFALAGTTTLDALQLTSFMRQSSARFRLVTAGFYDQTALAGLANTALLATGDANLNGGAITTATINAAGVGYAVNDTGFVDPSTLSNATYRVTTIGALGIVTGFTITDGGYGYAVQNGYDTDTSGVGTGFKLNVTAITPGNGSLRLVTRYWTPQLS